MSSNGIVKEEEKNTVDKEEKEESTSEKMREIRRLLRKDGFPAGTSTVERHCAYCYEKFPAFGMIPVPSNNAKKMRWMKSLGQQFKIYITRFKQPVICRRHFHSHDFSVSGNSVLPNVYPHPDPIYEGRKLVDGEDDEVKVNYQVIQAKCVYCGLLSSQSKMRLITRDFVAKRLWCRKLGEAFRTELEGNTSPYMCSFHFHKLTWVTSESLNALALPALLGEESMMSTNCCTYCYKVDYPEKMIAVPGGLLYELWTEELGKRFQTISSIVKFPSICKAHFKNYESTEDSDGVLIPFPDEYIIDSEIEEEKMFHWESQQKKGTLEILKMRNKFQYSRNYWFKCTYCYRTNRRCEMVRVPLDEDTLEKWATLLGHEFEEKLPEIVEPWVCKLHFETADFDEEDKLKNGALPAIFEPEIESQVLFFPQTSASKKCVYCKRMNHSRNMRQVVKCPLRRSIWIHILGKEFEEGCATTNNPMICRDHFCIGTYKNGTNQYAKTPCVLSETIGNSLDSALQSSSTDIVVKEEIMDEEPECSNPPKIESKPPPRWFPSALQSITDQEDMYKFGYGSFEEMQEMNDRIALSNESRNDKRWAIGRIKEEKPNISVGALIDHDYMR